MDGRKIYYSFHDIPDAYPYERSYGGQGIRFSEIEKRHIFIAIGVLTIAFAFALSPYPPLYNINSVLYALPISFVAIVTAFFCHEMAHKYMGQKYGYWSEFRMFPQGLMFALFLGVFLGVVFAAPGAVVIAGSPSKEESGKISVAGPATNILIAGLFFVLASFTGMLSNLFLAIAAINAFLAFFNLLPFGPLDGLKVFTWNKGAYGICFITSLLFLALYIYLS
jgi:Zn-dependent protease